MERRLAAIFSADVVGYSRLIRADEEGTLVALKSLRNDIIDPKVAEHHGRSLSSFDISNQEAPEVYAGVFTEVYLL